MEWILASFASLGAGFIDAIVGGGGMIMVPALFAIYPAAAAPTLLGTNKATAMWGTSIAATQFARRVTFRWHTLLPAVGAAFVGSFGGAYLATQVSGEFLRRLLPVILIAVFIYTMINKDLGAHHGPKYTGRTEIILACTIAIILGFYDGFFGPGTGSFFIFLLVRVLGYDFLNASANAKILNLGTNISALILFGLTGHVWWHLAIPLGIANIIGAILGAKVALKYGSKFVRWVFIIVVGALILKTALDAYL